MSRGRPEKRVTKEQIDDAIAKFRFMKDAAEYLDLSYPTFLKEKERLELGSEMNPKTPLDSKLELIDYQNIEEFINANKETDRHCKTSIGYNEVEIDINERCIVVPWGDWHIGNEHTRHSQLALDARYIKKHSNIYVVMMGDYTDNFRKYSPGSGVYEQIIPIPEQKQRVEYIVRYLHDRILGAVIGCHDKWMFDSDAFEFAQYLANKCKGYWMGFNGVFKLNVGKATYRIYASHKFQRWSSDNNVHGLKNAFRSLENFDVAFGAHRHIPALEHAWIRKKWFTGVRCSSYKITDHFIDQKELPKSPYCLPCVLLEADKKNVIAFKDLRTAVNFL
jgi:hypothetical protein